MSISQQIAGQFREVYLHGTWVATNLKTELSSVSFEQAQQRIGQLNTIAMLAYHIHYYVAGVLQVLEGGTLDIRDKYSFDLPVSLQTQSDWEAMLAKMWVEGERFASLLEQLSDEQLAQPFVEAKYGTYYRNMQVMVEHTYYHLGQLVLIKKLLQST